MQHELWSKVAHPCTWFERKKEEPVVLVVTRLFTEEIGLRRSKRLRHAWNVQITSMIRSIEMFHELECIQRHSSECKKNAFYSYLIR